MNKYNKLGMELLEYKQELSKDYPSLVLKSLMLSIDSMATNKIIDVDTHYALKDKDTSISSLKELLLTKTSCLKTHNELLSEYEVIRENLANIVGVTEREDIQTQSVVEKEKILLVQDFIITEEFIREYFFIESERDYETLMGRKGFLHKFAILRLEKILKDFIAIKETQEDINLSHSSVFYHEKKNLYGIQLVFSFDIELLENEDSFNRLASLTKDTIKEAYEYYNTKMIA